MFLVDFLLNMSIEEGEGWTPIAQPQAVQQAESESSGN